MILLIDDNKDFVDTTCKLINLLGFEATAVYNGKDGIAKAKELKPKLILCDIGMEDINGYQVAKYIRQDEELKDIHLIAISGYSSEDAIKLSIESGFNQHLNKPLDLEKLKSVLQSEL